MRETEPNGLDQHAAGAKMDGGKIQAALLKDFSLALLEVAKVATSGATKDSRGGWQSVEDGIARYDNAKWRHMLAERHEERDQESGLLHAAHEAWGALARLELILRGKR